MSGRKIIRGTLLALAVAAPLVVGAGSAQAAAPADPAPVACSTSADTDAADCSTPDDGRLNIGSQSTGAGAGRVTFNPFSISRKIDKSSP